MFSLPQANGNGTSWNSEFWKKGKYFPPTKISSGRSGLSPSIGRAAQTDEMFDNGGNLTRLVKSRGMSRSSPMNRIFPLSSYGELQVGLNLSPDKIVFPEKLAIKETHTLRERVHPSSSSSFSEVRLSLLITRVLLKFRSIK